MCALNAPCIETNYGEVYRGVICGLVHQVQQQPLRFREGVVEAAQDPLLQVVDVSYLAEVPQLVRLHQRLKKKLP